MHTSLKRNYQTLNTSSATPAVLWRRNKYILWQRGETLQKSTNALGSNSHSGEQQSEPRSTCLGLTFPSEHFSDRGAFSSLLCRCHKLPHIFMAHSMNFPLGILPSSFSFFFPSPSSHTPAQSPLNVHLQDICKLYLKR